MRKCATLIATVFGIGKIPIAPGTCASLFTLPLAWLIIGEWGIFGCITLTILLFLIGLWGIRIYLENSFVGDPPEVVIDEVIGQLIPLIFIQKHLLLYLVAFCLFRVFDIWKPLLIGEIDKKMKGPLGIILDDIAAGSLTAIVLIILVNIMNLL